MDASRRIQIRQMTADDVAQVSALQLRTFPGMEAWTPELLSKHIAVFPEGQLVAVDESDRILGSASSLIIDWDDYSESARWSAITGHGTFSTHNPLGKTLYGADMGVDPFCRRCGIGSLFYEARKKMVRERKLKRLLIGGRLPGYAQVAQEISVKQYVTDVVAGRRKDPTLNFQLKNGFVLLDVIPEYLHDHESRGFAALLEWLNPEYVTTVSMESEVAQETEEFENERLQAQSRPRRVRIAAIQYEVRPIASFQEFAKQVEFFIRSAEEYHSHFVMFPEYFTMQLLSYIREPAPARAVRLLAERILEYEELFKRLAKASGLYIIAGTHPILQEGQLFNAAHLFTPNGRVFRQKKVHLTFSEKGPYQMSRGHGFYVYHTDFGKIAILICYDVEFPEAARALAEAGAEILFVPSCTDDRMGFCRVRYCGQARTIENQIYVAITGTVGNLPLVPHMATNYSQAAIMTPSDYYFARDGIAAEAVINQEQMILADVDLELLGEQRVKGTVIPINDLIKDAYDRVIHYVDHRDSIGRQIFHSREKQG